MIAAILYARPWQSTGQASPGGIEALETQIAAGTADVQTWLAYGQALYGTGQFARSAMAYEKAIELEPYHRPARFQRGLALAKAGDREGLFDYLTAQLHQEPKLVAELLDRPELGAFLTEARYASLQKEARAQAMD